MDLYPVHMMGSSPLETRHILIYCLLRRCLPSPRCLISQQLLSPDLVPSQTHRSAHQNLITPQTCCAMAILVFCLCFSPFWMASRLPFPLCFVRGAEARTCIWKMTQQVKHKDYNLKNKNILVTSHLKFKWERSWEPLTLRNWAPYPTADWGSSSLFMFDGAALEMFI